MNEKTGKSNLYRVPLDPDGYIIFDVIKDKDEVRVFYNGIEIPNDVII